jgi:L-seryl-tRNA(Ser) seleniumtransferase
MLGGPQAGIIVGRRKYIDILRKHPLSRALRVDKLTYAALGATLESHRRGATAEVPVLAMLTATRAELGRRVDGVIRKVSKQDVLGDLKLTKIDGHSAVGGGAAPEVSLETCLIGVEHKRMSASKLEARLRSSEPPIIARTLNGRVVLDLRTVSQTEEAVLVKILLSISPSEQQIRS